MRAVTIDSNTETLLDEWGKWSRCGLGLGLGTPTHDNFHVINDQLALVVERVICRLKELDHTKALVIELRYRNDYTFSMLANRFKCGETRARQIFTQSYNWVDGYFDGYRQHLQPPARQHQQATRQHQ